MHPVTDWILVVSKVLLTKFPTRFDYVWKKIISVLRSNPDCGRSAIIRGSQEPNWAADALNAPNGKLAQALMTDPQKDGAEAGKGFPLPWIGRVNELLSLEPDLRRHALVMFAFNLDWFFCIDSVWTEKNLLCALKEEGPDQSALWAGFFWAAKIPNLKLYIRLKPHFLRLPKDKSIGRRNHSEILASILLAGWGTVDSTTGERVVTNGEMRDVLINADDSFRSHVLWQLGRWPSETREVDADWRTKLPIFLSEVWPRQKSVKTPRTTVGLCELAFSAVTAVPEILDSILPLVTKVDEEARHNLVQLEDKVVDQHPEKTLALLSAILPDAAAVWPYDVEAVLERIGNANPTLLKDTRLLELKRRWNAR
jgi:hypothetical protein